MEQQKRITLWEFIKPGWTFHAKGLWYTLPNQQKPLLTLIGSPNFGKFSSLLIILFLIGDICGTNEKILQNVSILTV